MKGMAETVFRLPFYTMAVLIANAQLHQEIKAKEQPTNIM